jgi:cellulose synthase (UDP-forming)
MTRIRTVAVWALLTVCIVVLITLPISLQTQLIASIMVVTAMAIIKLLKAQETWRLIALALGTSIVLRYAYWRTTSTLPPLNQPENFIPGFLLYLAEMYSIAMLALSLFVVARPLPQRPSRAADIKRFPKVDVFVPSYNEDAALLANTLAAAKGMDYPADKFEVWLLDDGSTEQKRNSDNVLSARAAAARHVELQALCRDLDVRYLTRARNEHAKAGNLNNGMAHSDGELVAVFDADHAPARDFLKETVGYFDDDPRLFLVQTPHFFLNPDPVERNLQTFEKMPSENEMFYGIIQRGLDKWNAAFFCGSAAVLNRKALEETEGFSGMSITEDCETALALHSRGWNSVYVDKPLIAGLQPATFASFIGQRSRWAQGMMQILRFRFPLLKSGLTIAQRLCYMSSTLFWLFPFPRTIFLVAPLFYLLFDLEIFTASGGEFLGYTLAYMLVNLMMQNYLYGSFRWPWISELYEYVQTVHLLPAVVSVILNPRKPTFKVTAKDESVLVSRLSEISRPFFVIFGVLMIGFFISLYKFYSEPYKADVTLVVGAWNVLNLIIAGCALGVVSERGEKSASRRVKVSRRCEFVVDGEHYPATMENVSAQGARIQAFQFPADTIFVDTPAAIRFRPYGAEADEELPVLIRNVQDSGDLAHIGCRFAASEARHHYLVADLIFANSNQWSDFQLARRYNPGLVRGTLWFLGTAFYQTSRGLVYLLRGIRTNTEARGAKAAATATALVLLASVLLLTPAPLLAATAAFDMSHERGNQPAVEVEKPVETPAAVALPATDATPTRLRYLVPFPKLTLDGEMANRSWTIYLTPVQAAAALKLNYGYRNAIFVAPETSKIAVYVNDTLVSEQPVQSPEGISERSIELPRDLLKPGANTIGFRVIQQHRTDCTVESTYQLWTEILPEKTYLALDPEARETAASMESVKAVGVDAAGRTQFDIVVPGLLQFGKTDEIMQLGQALALLGRMPNQSFSVTDTINPKEEPGHLTVVVGPAPALAALLPDLPAEARTATFTGFAEEPGSGRQVMVLSGPDAQSVAQAIAAITGSVEQQRDTDRDALATQAWTGGETPFLKAGTSLAFGKLGVGTTEFGGRRLRSGFEIGVPADFYAGAYGEAQILLDAAYSDDVLPGSHVDIYVNGNIASTVPITSTSGGLMRHLPIRLTMRHFRPGGNRIEIEAILKAKTDLACLPGAAAAAEPRFALFNTSEFHMPDFARIAELPSLSAIAGTGFPYGAARGKLTLFLDRPDERTLSAAATFLGKLALASGHPVDIATATSGARIGEGDAIFVGAISQIPKAALAQAHVSEAAITAWGNPSADLSGRTEDAEALDQWKSRLRGGSWLGGVSHFEDWMKATFDISLGSLKFMPAEEEDSLPPNTSTFITAQGWSPDGDGTWTVLAAPDGDELVAGTTFLSDEANWRDMSGRLVMLEKARRTLVSLPAMQTRLVETRPFSLANYRLIAANWLSINILSYAALFGGVSLVLGLATSALLKAFGRSK